MERMMLLYIFAVAMITEVAAQTTTATATTTQSWAAVISITTPSLTSSTLTLEHNMTSSGGEVTIRCSGTEGMATSSLYSLKLSRVLYTYPNSTPTSLLNMFHHNQEPQVLYPLDGATAFGSVTQNFLTLRMTRTRCNDAGVYICEATYMTNTIYTYTANQSLAVTVRPGYLSVTAYPAYSTWAANNTVTLTCSGPLGTPDRDAQVIWHWEYWDQTNFHWQRYDPPPSDVIPQGTSQLPCYESGAIAVRRTLQLADSERRYRCYVERRGITYVDYAGFFQFGRVISDSGDPSVGASTADERYNEGMAIGGGIGAASAVGFVIIVVLMCRICGGKNASCVGCSGHSTKDSIGKTPGDVAMETAATRNVALQTVVNVDDDDNPYENLNNKAATRTTMTNKSPLVEEPVEKPVMVYDEVLDLAEAQQQQAAAEEVLRTLLSTRHVLSWRVTSGQGYTSFILHLTPSADDHIIYSGLQHGRWHKKKRGMKRAVTSSSHHHHHHRVAMPIEEGDPETPPGVHQRRERLALPPAPSSSTPRHHHHHHSKRRRH